MQAEEIRKEIVKTQDKVKLLGKTLSKIESGGKKSRQEDGYYASLWTELFSINSKLTDMDRSLSYAKFFQNRHKSCAKSPTTR